MISRLRAKAFARIPGAYLFLIPGQDIRVGGRSSKAHIPIRADRSKHRRTEYMGSRSSSSKLQTVSADQGRQQRPAISRLQENVVIDRDAAARLGIQPQAVDSTLYSAFGQRQVSIIYTQQNQYHVVLEVDPQLSASTRASLDKIYVKSSDRTTRCR